ncbi:DUF6716 putative glycosyltransferase [Spongisporangium articulatum]|uniref:DUF6716 putative glycosyltransferase n=1 Tax=Spongisporangium articulatum TaxID=3362603 RepID=A0ABW8AH31_9ACTN
MTSSAPLRVLAVAESDSYLKWAASLLEQLAGNLPPGGVYEVAIPQSPIRPSLSQIESALSGTTFAGSRPPVLSPAALRRRVDRERPDAVLLACAGPTALALQTELARARHRPVILAGIPGIAVPARRKAWNFRSAIDLMVVHSHREVRDYDAKRRQVGAQARVGLARLPFLPGPDGTARAAESAGGAVVFATQGKVPLLREDRLAVLRSLARLAVARPDLQVIVKTRGVAGEFHTHYEAYHYGELWRELVGAGEFGGDELSFAAGSMAVHLRSAAALVTVSSTAALEAVAMGVPLLLVDEFGISEEMINEVFVGSGCLASLKSLEAGEFTLPDPAWLVDNYFHPDGDSTWVADLLELVEQARAGALPPLAGRLPARRHRRGVRRQLDRLRLTPLGSSLARARRRAREARQR